MVCFPPPPLNVNPHKWRHPVMNLSKAPSYMKNKPSPPPLMKNIQFEYTSACVRGKIPITMNTRYEAIICTKILLQLTQVADETMDPESTLLPHLHGEGTSQIQLNTINSNTKRQPQTKSKWNNTNATEDICNSSVIYCENNTGAMHCMIYWMNSQLTYFTMWRLFKAHNLHTATIRYDYIKERINLGRD